MIEIDGSYEEGGGQIIRTALALSTLTGKAFRAANIRKGRKKSGLKHQHIHAVNALKGICNADVEGDGLGSENLVYAPKEIKFSNLDVDIGTAGSITLLMQALLPVMLFADKTVTLTLKGGTDVKWSPSIDYFVHVLLPYLERYAEFEPSIDKRGYYPKGGGIFVLKIRPKFQLEEFDELLFLLKETTSFDLTTQGNLIVVRGISHASKDLMKAHVAERQSKSAKYMLSTLDAPVDMAVEYSDTKSTGSGITLYALRTHDEIPLFTGTDALGKRGKPAHTVGKEAAQQLLDEMHAPVDSHLADQLLIFLALSGGKMKVAGITKHLLANKYVIEKFLDVEIEIEDRLIQIKK